MSTKTSLTINEDLLDALAQAVPAQKSQLSILNVKAGKVAPEKMARLQSAGIIDAAGTIKQQYRQLLDALAKVAQRRHLEVHRWKPPFRIHRKLPRLQKPAVHFNSPRQQPTNHRSSRRGRRRLHPNRPEHWPQQNGKQQILSQTFPRRSHGCLRAYGPRASGESSCNRR